MNFLAHSYLSSYSVPLTVGNFIADFVKGNQINQYQDHIAKGINLHRNIDNYTDSHPVFKRSCRRLRQKYRHYSGVIIDLYYDHFLASKWDEFSDVTLEKFAAWIYKTMYDHFEIIPEQAKLMLPHMVRHNWLVNYASIEGIDLSLKGLSRRTRHESGMEDAAGDLIRHYNHFEYDFMEFFPQIIDYIRDKGSFR